MKYLKIKILSILLLASIASYGQNDVFKYRVDSTLVSDSHGAHEVDIWRGDNRLSTKFVVYYPKRSKLYVYGKIEQNYSIIEDHLVNDDNNGWLLESMTAIDKTGVKCDLTIIMYAKSNKNWGLVELIIDYTTFKLKYEMGKDD